jgi:hypothetical protein
MKGTLHEARYTFFIISLSVLLTIKSDSDKSCRGNQNTNFEFNSGFKNSCRLSYYVETSCILGQTTDDNMVEELCMLDA